MRKCCANCGWLCRVEEFAGCGIPNNMIKTPEYMWIQENAIDLDDEMVLREHNCAFFEQRLESDCG